MNKPSPKTVTVQSTQTITPNMQRITLSGDGLAEFPHDCEGGYIKLLFDQQGHPLQESIEGQPRPTMRTYTIRRFDHESRAIEVDFVRHLTHDRQCGFAARWAMNAKVGDQIALSGPGAISTLNTQADWFFMVADMTAMPALSAHIRHLPKDAQGYIVIQVTDLADIQPLDPPEDVKVVWLDMHQSLPDVVREQTWRAGEVSVWCACEFDSMRQLRQYFRNEKDVERHHIYISSYWKQGVAEDGHKVLKKQDALESL
ncbi:siderophore-interacting protein [Vibrio ostreicida]|uniref:Siderophore-interacting protein n=1 Tax=Vibrio ostreicida TaxID=526588 RepID=A0ABT8BYY8_9VIBR|nr:siderophore-interacting protein [Vibrio ostreicida]MDN3611904.1 siderophore-interacting protein [Vibrio ostreicida]NPD08913.1 siderophore-interacting protein [Vibrio ostreicida]